MASVSYSRLRELLWDKIAKLGFDPQPYLVCSAFVLVVPLQQPMLVCMSDCLSHTVAGNYTFLLVEQRKLQEVYDEED